MRCLRRFTQNLCPSAFRLRRFAQSVFPGLGIRLLTQHHRPPPQHPHQHRRHRQRHRHHHHHHHHHHRQRQRQRPRRHHHHHRHHVQQFLPLIINITINSHMQYPTALLPPTAWGFARIIVTFSFILMSVFSRFSLKNQDQSRPFACRLTI